MTVDLSNYELKRKTNIEENQNLLRQLGLGVSEGIAADIPHFEPNQRQTKKSKKRYNRAPPKPKAPVRLSRRIRGQTPEEITDLSEVVDENDRVRQLEIAEKEIEQEDTLSLSKNIHVPLTLRSIGTTIWSLGELNTGKGRSKAWSSRGCKYKHPYPIGYRATKSHFGNDYTMGITLSAEGEPNFTVQINSTTFNGKTPTAPWTEACIRSRSSSTRVSGPLFFGFSDPVTMHLIEKMEGYKEASLPEDSKEIGT
ncbi:hypothetical protein G6F57_002255 [Rhizopus arrhizus]|uniref:FYR N-terminal domain-containing protein n=1 Tax=Rhizopus oryzae TaxID=64495 RepID=A0A9P6XEM3_RHIOR|nr:hypothetical protein G6F23_001047 [Rhizopus arrhizus]KAG0765013.1 hypothetical protein G6F24_004761 [Rhizopus arrhizus]KAG0796684.1 hypothetical protein G6F21_001110 [Rhizopus arrhizus]KAG0812741.1 hypothetical protein G6F20_006119 [Rhizopus arrhizus]KAG0832530.1 hypothetical protein G6F19_006177 [Rhizopus arrhizus]